MSGLLWFALSLAALGQSAETASSQDFALELRLGPYRPEIDKSFAAGQGPYAQVFGKKWMLLGELELDWQFFHGFGSLGVGVASGYAEVFGKAFLDVAGGERSAQTTALKIIPIKLLLVWRMDIFANRYDIPFVPYAKLGLMLNHWWSTKGGKTSEAGGEKASGWRSGWLGVLGLALQLDAFDRQLAKNLDTGIGINHSYVFAEYAFEQVQNFSKKGMNLSSGHWMFGLAFEF
ncbi:MAG: MXAN_2562 family outer membrane beta-barrel protein [Cystobacterineae bacterium]|nr:MXAN_2562 family outer membrane beta-barrel protein [Cystobacterineae bacterium]